MAVSPRKMGHVPRAQPALACPRWNCRSGWRPPNGCRTVGRIANRRSEDAVEGQERSAHPDRPGNTLRQVFAQLLAADRGGGGNADRRRTHADPHHERGPGAVSRRRAASSGSSASFVPHRGTDLSYGRVEDGGLRCLYHGWLFDRHGKCLDQPAEPREPEVLRPDQAPRLSGAGKGRRDLDLHGRRASRRSFRISSSSPVPNPTG